MDQHCPPPQPAALSAPGLNGPALPPPQPAAFSAPGVETTRSPSCVWGVQRRAAVGQASCVPGAVGSALFLLLRSAPLWVLSAGFPCACCACCSCASTRVQWVAPARCTHGQERKGVWTPERKGQIPGGTCRGCLGPQQGEAAGRPPVGSSEGQATESSERPAPAERHTPPR